MSRDFAHLARRISSVTTNCLLSAVVLVAGLTFGRQVLRWWADDPAERIGTVPAVDDVDGLGDPWRLHVVQFGDRPWSLGRQSIAGDKTAAAAALRAACREVVQQDNLPDVPDSGAVADFLPRLEASEPIEQQPGQWRLYAFDEVVPMVVGTRPRGRPGSRTNGGGPSVKGTAPSASRESGQSPGDPAAAAQRVVVWGMAMPMDGETWTVFTFQPDAAVGLASDGLPEVPLPDGCRRTLSMRVAGGGATLAFEGPQGPEQWTDFYDRWFAVYNWKAEGGWQRFGQKWYARYVARGRTGADRSTFISAASRPGQARGC